MCMLLPCAHGQGGGIGFQADRVARGPITRSFQRGESTARLRTSGGFVKCAILFRAGAWGWYTRPLYLENEESLKTQKGNVSCSDFSFLKIPLIPKIMY